jgi:hypothetical protein
VEEFERAWNSRGRRSRNGAAIPNEALSVSFLKRLPQDQMRIDQGRLEGRAFLDLE